MHLRYGYEVVETPWELAYVGGTAVKLQRAT